MVASAAESLGLYLSVPFCRAKCSFCNFASGVGSPQAVDRYVGHLCAEIQGARAAAVVRGVVLPERVDSVYFGGGTPSLLSPVQLERVLRALRAEFTFAADAEMTLEAAPGQIGEALLATAMAGGVNRVSLGVQSFVDREAQAVGRSHTRASCLRECERLQRAGVHNVGVDLIAGLPHQTEGSWAESLRVAGQAGLQHISVYMLEVDEDSRLGREVLHGGARLHAPAVPSEDLIAALYEQACERLPEAGFRQYEISNFAAEGFHSRHNLKYWTRAPYLGLGLDAHSMLRAADGRALRWANADDLTAYPDRAGEAAWVSQREAFEETVFLRLRLVEGISRTQLAPFPKGWVADLEAGMTALADDGLMRRCRENWQLTPAGRLVSSSLFGELLTGACV